MVKKATLLFSVIFLVTSCAAGVNPKQRLAYQEYKEKGLLIESRNPEEASSYGFLPGGASFYNGDYDVGLFNILLWPVSILWEVMHGSDRAKFLNLEDTEREIYKKFKSEIAELDELNYLDQISTSEYNKRAREIFKKYYNRYSHLLARYRSIGAPGSFGSNNSSGGASSSGNKGSSFLSKIEEKIYYTCSKEYKTLKKEMPSLEKDSFIYKCSIRKRKQFVELGL